jgi:hypothetical protein
MGLHQIKFDAAQWISSKYLSDALVNQGLGFLLWQNEAI